MSETPKRLTWEEMVGSRQLRELIVDRCCPGTFREGLPGDGATGCDSTCRTCWAAYLPEGTPTDKED